MTDAEFNELVEKVYKFHTKRAPGIPIGVEMVLLAKEKLGDVDVIAEDLDMTSSGWISEFQASNGTCRCLSSRRSWLAPSRPIPSSLGQYSFLRRAARP